MTNEIIAIVVIAFTWSNLLTKNGEIFDFWRTGVQYLTLNQKINKMLYDCEKCVAGQIALWHVVISDWQNWNASHFLIVPYCIFVAYFLVIFHEQIQKYINK